MSYRHSYFLVRTTLLVVRSQERVNLKARQSGIRTFRCLKGLTDGSLLSALRIEKLFQGSKFCTINQQSKPQSPRVYCFSFGSDLKTGKLLLSDSDEVDYLRCYSSRSRSCSYGVGSHEGQWPVC